MNKSLNGKWELYSDGNKICDLTIPGSVLSGMLENSLIEDPFFRANEYETRRLLYKDYDFVKHFDIELDDSLSYELIFEGIDTASKVYLNGELIFSTDNMFKAYESDDIKSILKEKDNLLEVKITSPMSIISTHENAPGKEITYISTGVLPGAQYMRKAGSSFGWDWGPELPDMGIHKDVYIRATDTAILRDSVIIQEHKDNMVSLDITTDIDIISAFEEGDLNIYYSLVDPDGELVLTKSESLSTGGESSMLIIDKQTIEINDPKLWWPRGYGEQPLYTLIISLINGENVIGDKQYRIGLRTVTVNRDKIGDGENFAVTVNGVQIFLMGANYIPEDVIYNRITVDTYKRLLDAAAFANYNCLRVWGGGYYPDDDFLNLMDEYGILLWQDMMYACLVYEVDDDFLENVIDEAYVNIRRISNHACLALVAGNNEMEYAWKEWGGYKDHSDALKTDYQRLFEVELPKVINEVSPKIFYWPSSPSKGGGFKDLLKEDAGDTHYWTVWHGEVPFSEYENHKFRMCSEFGFQSFPCLKTVKTYTNEEDRNIFSPVMECHQKNASANGKIMKYLYETFRMPSDFDNLLYASQLLQALALKTAVDHFRRNRGDCMGALYWQINDNWPVASWSTVDYYGRYKAAHYFAKRFYNPVSATIVIKKNGEETDCPIISFEQMALESKQALNKKVPLTYSVIAYIANETMYDVKVQYTIKLIDMDFNIIESKSGEISADKLSSALDDAFNLTENAYNRRRELMLVAEFDIDGEKLYDIKPLVNYKALELKKADIKVSTSVEDDMIKIRLSSNAVALFVELESDDADLIFSDNYFDLVSADERVIYANMPEGYDANKLPLITARSLRDSY
ncbi:MAG: glycoside hydrolase family 2 protein [Lachnospiraceae bacterium]|nr:glycoside hydrolase family 2 protein [Lachnospiraceae bacterium]